MEKNSVMKITDWIFPFIVAALMADSLNTRLPQLGEWICHQE